MIEATFEETLAALKSEGIRIFEVVREDEENYGLIRYRIGQAPTIVEFTCLYHVGKIRDVICEPVEVG